MVMNIVGNRSPRKSLSQSPRNSIASQDARTTSTDRSDPDDDSRDTCISTIGPPPSRITSPQDSGPTAPDTLPPPIKKPLASTSGGGASLAVSLAEPTIFLTGYEPQEYNNERPAMLRGSLLVRLSKPTKIKAINLHFRGRARTEWPEGIPPRKTEFHEERELINHSWPFFNAHFPMAEHSHGADSARIVRSSTSSSNPPSNSSKTLGLSSSSGPGFLSSRSFGKNDGATTQMRGYRLFAVGEYVYNFETPIPSQLPESIECAMGSVRYELEAIIERQGAFKSDVRGKMPLEIVRLPGHQNLEGTEPIAISRNWEDQLHYDIVVAGKSFPIGTQIPIAFKLTPLSKVRVHRIKVFVTENVEYACKNKKVHRLEPQRRILLLEKAAEGSSTSNMLGDLEGMATATSTEFEATAKLPTCQSQGRDRLHFDTTYQNIKVHHWIKVVLRLSKQDDEDHEKRRHFEISIDSPVHILSCRCTQNNLLLPAYGTRTNPNPSRIPCPCTQPDLRTPDVSSAGMSDPMADAGAAVPQDARPDSSGVTRPMHLIRNPSINPPAFDDETCPPPMMTPPPPYEGPPHPSANNGPPSEYFASLSVDPEPVPHQERSEDDLEIGRRRSSRPPLGSGDLGLGPAGLLSTPDSEVPAARSSIRPADESYLWQHALTNRARSVSASDDDPSIRPSSLPHRPIALRQPPLRHAANVST